MQIMKEKLDIDETLDKRLRIYWSFYIYQRENTKGKYN